MRLLGQQRSHKTQTYKRLSTIFQERVTKTQVNNISWFNKLVLDLAMAFCYRGRCYMHMQEYKRALYDFSAAIRAEAKEQKDYSKNNLAWYYQFSGQCNLLLGQYEEALIHFDIGLSKNETKPLYFYRGITNVSLQRF